MPEEVTYATIKFSNTSKTVKPQESCSLKKTDNHEVPELELDGAAGNGTGRIENTVEVAGSRAVRDYQQLFFSNRTAHDGERRIIERWERNIPLFMDICKNLSSEHIIFKKRLETTLEALNNFPSKDCEDLKQKKKELTSPSCSASCVCHEDSKKGHCFLMNMDDGKNGNKTQLPIRCVPLPISWMDLNCTLDNTNKGAKNVADFCILTCLAP
ncbi:uncharacterized protein RBU33_024298 isoform 3-T4 [Hipposideros larvatus]